jgi:hypothetical protein
MVSVVCMSSAGPRRTASVLNTVPRLGAAIVAVESIAMKSGLAS